MNHTFLLLLRVLGDTLLQSLWQIALAYLLYKCFTWLLQDRNQWVYTAALTTMLACFGWSIATFSHLYHQEIQAQALQLEAAFVDIPGNPAALPAPVGIPEADPSPALAAVLSSYFRQLQQYAPWLGGVWLVVLAGLWIRLLGGYVLAQQLRRKGVKRPDAAFLEIAQQWTQRLRIQRVVQFLESPYISEPLTLGFWKPVVLFPAGMLLQLHPAQVEALLIHELAHVRRYDYLVNLVQVFLETLFFYHPLYRLLSTELRTRREYACDDLVVQQGADPLLYARTLTDLQLVTHHSNLVFAMQATGKYAFTARIMRLAGIRPQHSRRSGIWVVLPLFLMVVIAWFRAEDGIAREIPAATWMDLLLPERDSVTPGKSAPRPTPGAAPAIVNTSAGDEPAAQTPVAIELSSMNVLYIGVDNPVVIAVPNVPAEEIRVKLDREKGTISGQNGNYIARMTVPGPVSIQVYRVKSGVETLIGAKNYRVKRIPDPQVVFSLHKGGTVTKSQLLKHPEVQLFMENFDFDAVFTVSSYTLTILPREGDPITYNEYQSTLSPRIIEQIKALPTGSALFFDDIKGTCPGDTAPRNLGGIAFKITAPE
jgi:beta-lactamase regulating signal transducer with metallopeptidase domain